MSNGLPHIFEHVHLHEAHPGVSHMKALGRSYMWWPGMDRGIEKLVFNCKMCQINQEAPVHH